MKKFIINLIIALAVGCIFIVLMFTNQSADDAIRILKSIEYIYILFAFMCMVLLWVLGSLAIRIVKRGMIGRQKDPGGNFLSIIVHEFFCAVTPFSSGGQPALVYVLTKKGLDAGTAASIAIIRSFLYQVTELALSIFGFLLLRNYLLQHVSHFYAIFIPAIIICSVIVGIFLAFLGKGKLANKTVSLVMLIIQKFMPKKHEKIEKSVNESLASFKEGVRIFKTRPWFWVFSVLIQIAELLSIYMVPVFMLRAIEGSFDNALPLMVCTCICSIIMSYVPTPGTTGGAEGFAVLLITPFFVSSPALPVILIWRLITYYFKILFGGIGFMVALKGKGSDRKKVKAKAKDLISQADSMM
ncbi:MAG: lysylphosphatidylglycerol synthase transmembrane domain-containing protein [Clostridia bacterium]|nr:lysylphosphatidylglycerol synthase transmembrane domain-containing protein [Clostridia bacterium]